MFLNKLSNFIVFYPKLNTTESAVKQITVYGKRNRCIRI